MNRFWSFVIVLAVYVLAAACGILTYILLNLVIANQIILMLLADVAATLVVWCFGLIFKNASMYDPYWSIQSLVIIAGWLYIRNTALNIIDIFMLIAVGFWAVRLTYNWASTFYGIKKTQDWRYVMLKQKNPKLYFITNLFGINLMPTTLVYLGTVPIYYLIFSKPSFNGFTVFGFLIMILAVLLELGADIQMKNFRQTNKDKSKVMDKGLWAYSRHPNYLGEVTFWWGLLLFAFSNIHTPLYVVIGAISITLLFLFISIPMIENKMLSSRPAFKDYQKRVSMLLLLPNKKLEEEPEKN